MQSLRHQDAETVVLDQFSTSHTNPQDLRLLGVDPATIRETQAAIEEAEDGQAKTCTNGAPFLFFVDNSGRGRLVQGNCHDWTCARCGVLRAKHEYGNMVYGAKELQRKGLPLYFATCTCRGKELSAKDSLHGYGKWTDRLTTAMRNKANRSKHFWSYSAVTEKQSRGHPHSHMIVTYCPADAVPYFKGDYLPNKVKAKHDGLYSQWFVDANIRAGLGPMCDYSEIKSPIAVAVYLGKYLFKEAIRTAWPPRWKRIRYANSWPKLPERKPEISFPLVHYSDWLRMDALGIKVFAESDIEREAAWARLITCVV